MRPAVFVASLGFHAAVLLGLILGGGAPPAIDEPPTITVTLLEPPPAPQIAPAPAGPAVTVKAEPAAPRRAVRETPASPDVPPLPMAPAAVADPGPGLTDGQLAGAAMAGSGRGGGGCDMAGRLQDALRRDPLVRAAAARLAGRAVLGWNGAWVKSHDEDGEGLAAVREAVMWEIAFAPESCRMASVRGLVVFTLGSGPGAARLAVGKADWRWADLVTRNR